MWVRSLEDFAKALKIVEPKRKKKQAAEEELKKKIDFLNNLEREFKELQEKVDKLNRILTKTNQELETYRRELEVIQLKIDRGDKLISGLSGEKTRWEATLIELDDNFSKLPGDCILSAAFMSYCGPFPSEYRESLISSWIAKVESLLILYSKGFDFSEFMAGAALARQWQINGLPTDKFSTENGVFVTQGLRWVLNIDPQTQAMNWVKRSEGDQLIIAD